MSRIPSALQILVAHSALVAAAAQTGPATSVRALDLYRHGDCKQAGPLFEEILSRQPKNTPVRKLYANCLAQEGKQDQARAQYRMVLTASPNDPEALQGLGPAGNSVVAGSAATALRPSKPESPLARADALTKVHKGSEAEKAPDQGAVTGTPSVVARQRLAELHSSTRRYAEAAELYTSLARATNHPMYLARAAQNRAWNKEYDAAITLFREYLTRVPTDMDARRDLANVLMWSGKLDEADSEFRSYVELKPDDVDARLSFANVLLWTGRYADALEQFNAVKAARPHDPRPDVAIAQSYERMGQLEQALRSYDDALKQNPSDLDARDARTRLEAELPRRKAFDSIQSKDNEGAAKFFVQYLKEHPESDETVLQIARAFVWAKKPREAVPYYRQYLKRKPDDITARRELAKTELVIPDYTAAREVYEELVSGAAANADDYEQLIHAYVWDNKVAGAQQVAAKLTALDRDNAVAREAIEAYAASEKSELIEQARSLAAARRFPEAIDIYRDYGKRFGKDQQTELMIARLYSWNEQNPDAATAYHNYLLKYPGDTQARLEMAKAEVWSKDYKGATADFRAVLKSEPRNSDALLGLAQVSDYSVHDPFSVIRGYRAVLAADPKNTIARDRVAELTPMVTPSIGYGFKSFGDSDGFYRALNVFDGGFPFAGNLKLTPYYQIGYFHQLRQVGGANCGDSSPDYGAAAAALSLKVCDRNGTYWGNGGGFKAQIGSLAATNFAAEMGTMSFGGAPSIWTTRANLTLAVGDNRRLSFQVMRTPGVFDLNTVSSLAAGVVGETALASYTTPIGNRWRLGAQAGVTHYSAGTGGFSTNLQRRLSAQMSYIVVPAFTAGYYVRYNSFQRESPLYFSPHGYGEYGFAYTWRHEISKQVRFLADGEIGLGQIRRFGMTELNTVEMAVQPTIAWQVSPGLELRLGYRLSRGRASAFGSPAYTTGGGDFGLVKSLADMPRTFDPAHLNLY